MANPAELTPSSLPAWPAPFDPGAELDWGDPVISRRVLLEHLDQDHDGASRRVAEVDRHVRRLAALLPAPPADVLDAGCGPGLYAVRLAATGHRVVGIDAGPAVVAHACGLAAAAGLSGRAEFRSADLRSLSMTEDFDAVLLIYFILEGFARRQQVAVLRRLAARLRPGGVLIAELRVRPDQPAGRISSWDVVSRSLLADSEHLLLTDTTWDPARRVYILREAAVFDDGRVAVQQTTGRLVTLAETPRLFERAGLGVEAVHDGWSRYPATGLSESLLVVARRPRSQRRQAARGRPRTTGSSSGSPAPRLTRPR